MSEKKTKHTPGPWKSDGELIYAGEFKYDPVKGHHAWIGHQSIAEVTGMSDGLSEEEDLSNACLIAAAPEMLEALRLIAQAEDAGALVIGNANDMQSQFHQQLCDAVAFYRRFSKTEGEE